MVINEMSRLRFASLDMTIVGIIQNEMYRLRFALLDMTLAEHSDRNPSHKQRAKPGMAAYSILPVTSTEALTLSVRNGEVSKR